MSVLFNIYLNQFIPFFAVRCRETQCLKCFLSSGMLRGFFGIILRLLGYYTGALPKLSLLCVCAFFLCFCVHGDVFIESDSHFIHTLNANASQMTDLY